MRSQKNKRSKSGAKKRTVVLMTAFFIMASFILIKLAIRLSENRRYASPVLSVNGEVVTYREFKLFMDSYRANTIQEFQNQYKEDGLNFWDKSFNGEEPGKYLLDHALAECKKAKTEQILAKTNGVTDDISYQAFLESLKIENKRRADAEAKNEVIYGPVVYSESFYYKYLLDGYRQKLKDKDRLEGEMQIRPTEEQLRSFYETNKDSRYKNADDIRVYAIYVPYKIKGRDTEYTKEEAKARIEEAAGKLEAGDKFEDVAAVYNPEEGTGENFGERIFNEATRRNDTKYEKGLREYVNKLNIGQISDIFEYQNRFMDAGYYLFQCVDRKDAGHKPFEEVKAMVEQEYGDQKYEELVDTLLKQADVKLEEYFYRIGGKEINESIRNR